MYIPPYSGAPQDSGVPLDNQHQYSQRLEPTTPLRKRAHSSAGNNYEDPFPNPEKVGEHRFKIDSSQLKYLNYEDPFPDPEQPHEHRLKKEATHSTSKHRQGTYQRRQYHEEINTVSRARITRRVLIKVQSEIRRTGQPLARVADRLGYNALTIGKYLYADGTPKRDLSTVPDYSNQ